MHVPSPESSNVSLLSERIEKRLRIHGRRATQAERHGQPPVANSAVCSYGFLEDRSRSSVYFGDVFSDRLLVLSAHVRELYALPSLLCPDHCPGCLQGHSGNR